MKRIITFTTLIVITLCTVTAYAQYDANAVFPEVGKPMPNFTIQNLEDYPKTSASLNDFKGKWLILDFWSKYCSGCIKSFPKMNALYKKYEDKVQLVEICYIWHEGGEQALYANLKKNLHLGFPVAFDSLVCQRFNVSDVPHIFIIAPNGIVKGITNRLDEDDLKEFLKGNTPSLPATYNGPKTNVLKIFDRKTPYLINGNGGADTSFVYRFVLAKWNKEAGYYGTGMKEELAQIPSRIDLPNTSLRNLYFYAFTAHYNDIPFKDPDYQIFYPVPLIETRDSSKFKNSITADNAFSFSLTMPPKADAKENTEQFKKALQKELEIYFGYDAQLETRMMPYYKLVIILPGLINSIRTMHSTPSINGG